MSVPTTVFHAGDRFLPAAERLMRRVNKLPNGCWEWTGKITSDGYGACGYRGHRHILAHRAFYVEMVGPIPDGLTLDHLCHTLDTDCQLSDACPHRRCVNPVHLEPVTVAENNQRGGMSRRKTCPKGHPYDDENTLISNGRRYCRKCQRVHADRNSALRTARRAAARLTKQHSAGVR